MSTEGSRDTDDLHDRNEPPDIEDAERRHDAVLQRIIAEVAQHSEGRSVDEVMDEMQDRINAEGLESPTPKWLDAVARDASAGHVYVMTAVSMRDAGVNPHTADTASDAGKGGSPPVADDTDASRTF